MTKSILPEQAKDLLSGDGEIAFLDLREAGPFSEGHPLFAVPCPWSGFEAEIAHLAPRKEVPVILIDGGDGVSAAAAEALSRSGYGDVSIIDGGAAAWDAAGFTLFKGVHVPSKTLGELAEEAFHPGAIQPHELAAWICEGRAFLLYDCRPAAEYRQMTIPGAVCLPNGELPHRLNALPDVPIVITCAGRTRGIVGAASLDLVAPTRRIYWLEDGTQGWKLAGYDLQYGNSASELPTIDEKASAATRARAQSFLDGQRIPLATADDISAMRVDGNRTTYFIDVRTSEEVGSDPIPGFVHAPVVQLVQATDRLLAVQRARVVLADDLGLRGAIAAFWLRALGYEPSVALISDRLQTADIDVRAGIEMECGWRIGPKEALSEVAGGRARLVDVRSSSDFAAGHVNGAVWSIRPRLKAIPEYPSRLLLVGDETPRADLAWTTLRQLNRRDVAIVEGGMPALVDAGATIGAARPLALSEACDVTSFAHGRHEGNRDASLLYLSWEKGLVGQLTPEERARFRI